VEAAKAVAECKETAGGPCGGCLERLDAALAAWESRGPLEGDESVLVILDALKVNERSVHDTAVLLDRALTGERGAAPVADDKEDDGMDDWPDAGDTRSEDR